MWSGIEACASTVCANMPCYAPLLTRGHVLEYLVNSIQSLLSRSVGRFSRRGSSRDELSETKPIKIFVNEVGGLSDKSRIREGIPRSGSEKDVERG